MRARLRQLSASVPLSCSLRVFTWRGLYAIPLLRLCSATAGVYTEFLLKKLDYSTDFQNMLLYSWGVLFCLLGARMAALMLHSPLERLDY